MIALVLLGCPAPVEQQGWTDTEIRLLASLRLDVTPRPDPTNRWADDPAAARLGAAVFFDPGVSPHGISCGTCHLPETHFTDGLVRSKGVAETPRHTPTVVGSQWGAWYGWDGRTDSLWAQAGPPLIEPGHMGSDRLTVVGRVVGAHGERWQAAFGEPPDLADPAAVEAAFVKVLKALAAYERTLVPQEARFDRYVDALVSGDPEGGGHLSAEEVLGARVFVGQGRCLDCHSGPMFTDRSFHNLGLPGAGGDLGRTIGAMRVAADPYNCAGPWSDAPADQPLAERCPELVYLDPAFPDFQSAFKTPGLRDVTRTAPYMHDGRFPTLEGVIEFYDDLPGDAGAGHRELTLARLGLSDAQRGGLLAFLGALEGGPLPDAVVHPP